eukprot:5999053-Alexandrium_andersonii.AAC.1
MEELVALLAACERAGWPPALTRWRQVHLPKDDDEVPLVTRLRPIAIAPVVVRAWSRCRTRQLTQWLEPA